jgi:hypothetical protein
MASVHASIRQVTPGFLEAMGIRLVAGRFFSDADTATSMRVVIVNRAFAREYLGEPAVGQKLPSSQVVGVTEDVHQGSVTDPATPELYDCAWQLPDGIDWEDQRLVVRSAGDPLQLVPVLRGAVAQADRRVVVDDVRTMEDRVTRSLARPRLYAVLLAGFAAFALLIAAVGLFGVLSYSVAQRSREMGVRAALGARPSDIVRLVVGQGVAMAATGLAVGLLLCSLLLKPLSALLYGVTVHDPWSYALVAALLLAVSAAACAIPARRASRMDPLKVLRA